MKKTQGYKILLIDEDPEINDLLLSLIKKDEYSVITTASGKESIDIATTYLPEIVIVDLELPDIDGIEVCEKLREIPKMKDSIISFLTSNDEGFAQISAFESGAYDFIKKPISARLLLTKIKVYTKAYNKFIGKRNINDSSVIKTGSFIIYPDKYAIFKDNKMINLPKKEFDLLVLLASNKDKVISRDEIYDKLWGENSNILERTIDVHIKKLRDKIDKHHIITLKKTGFKFIDN